MRVWGLGIEVVARIGRPIQVLPLLDSASGMALLLANCVVRCFRPEFHEESVFSLRFAFETSASPKALRPLTSSRPVRSNGGLSQSPRI